VRTRRSALRIALLLAAAGAGCRHAAIPPAPLPDDWRSLVHEPAAFAALYRLSVGSARDLVLTVRSGGDRVSLTVAVPPGGVALAVWISGDEGWLGRIKERCREPLPPGVIPLPKNGSLPLDARLAALLLSGSVPGGAREVGDAPGWVEAATGGVVWRARIGGPPAACSRVVVTRANGASLFTAELGSQVGQVPGTIVLEAGSERAELALKEWHPSETPPPPAWLSTPACGELR